MFYQGAGLTVPQTVHLIHLWWFWSATLTEDEWRPWDECFSFKIVFCTNFSTLLCLCSPLTPNLATEFTELFTTSLPTTHVQDCINPTLNSGGRGRLAEMWLSNEHIKIIGCWYVCKFDKTTMTKKVVCTWCIFRLNTQCIPGHAGVHATLLYVEEQERFFFLVAFRWWFRRVVRRATPLTLKRVWDLSTENRPEN